MVHQNDIFQPCEKVIIEEIKAEEEKLENFKEGAIKIDQKCLIEDEEVVKADISNSDDSDSSFDECVGKRNSNESPSKKQILVDEKTLKKLEKKQAKFERALSKILDDFSDVRYHERRDKLPCVIKVSNTMLADMLKSITKDKIELPIQYNEPLSMLQKLCERFQYSYLLNKAASVQNKLLQLGLICGFILGEVSLNINRILKPFNPILGETYEFYDNDLHFRYFSEQVSHHPPITAYICESEDYVVFGDSRCKSKFKMFKGAMEIFFSNRTHIIFKTTNDHITYSKPLMYLKGLIMGKPRYDFSGPVIITNHNTEEVCEVEFFEEGKKGCPNGYMEGKVISKNKDAKLFIRGSWLSSLYLIEIKSGDEKELKNLEFQYLVKNAISLDNYLQNHFSQDQKLIVVELWSIHQDEFIKTFDDNNYKVSSYACNLNNINEALVSVIPKTDSRHRPDQRALENQNLELAEKEKRRIEDKQRKRHKIFEENKIKYEPKYFNEVLDTFTNEHIYLYKGDYWQDRIEGKFEDVYQIFFD